MSILMVRIAGKIALGLPVAPMLHRPAVGEPTNIGWLDRPAGVLLQSALVTFAAALLALYY